LMFLSAAILVSISLAAHSSPAADGPKIAIAYGGNVLGYLEPCG
jgi:hypothetical protein